MACTQCPVCCISRFFGGSGSDSMTAVAVSSLVIITGLRGDVVVGSIIAQVSLGPPIGERDYSKDGRARVLIST